MLFNHCILSLNRVKKHLAATFILLYNLYNIELFQELIGKTIQADTGSTIMKMITMSPMVIIQLFVQCYMFDILHNQVHQ